mmetsp:Transcript_23756/g.42622  ORF Transcript_23756/g.42622 Transcript_23756/m.42622 type:complete len:245 (+) Transcript_23756:1980-2714(+)
MGGHTCHHLLGGRAKAVGGPHLAHHFKIAADPAGGHDDGWRAQCKFAHRITVGFLAALCRVVCQHRAADAFGSPVFHFDPVNLMAEFEVDQSGALVLHATTNKVFDNARPGAPGDVKPRDRIAMAIGKTAATLGPANHWKPAQPHGVQPWAHLGRGEVDIGLGPFARHGVFGAVKLCAAHPVIQGQVAAVANAHAPLFRRVDHQEATKRPERLTAQKAARLLIHDYNLLAPVPQFGGGCEARKP